MKLPVIGSPDKLPCPDRPCATTTRFSAASATRPAPVTYDRSALTRAKKSGKKSLTCAGMLVQRMASAAYFSTAQPTRGANELTQSTRNAHVLVDKFYDLRFYDERTA